VKIIRMTIITGNDESSKTTESLVDGSDYKMSYLFGATSMISRSTYDDYCHYGLSYGWSEGMSGSL